MAYTIDLHDIANQDPAYVETIFALGNGQMGVRASDPIQASATAGTLINGFFESSPITYGEAAFGYAKDHQTIVNLPDSRQITVTTDTGVAFTHSERLATNLNLQTGELHEQFVLTTDSGKTVQLDVLSVMGQTTSNYGIQYTFTGQTYTGKLRVKKALLEGSATVDSDDPRKTQQVTTLSYSTDLVTPADQRMEVVTRHSHLHIMMQLLGLDGDLDTEIDIATPQTLHYIVRVAGVGQELANVEPVAFATIQQDSADFWDHVWAQGALEIDGDDSLTQALQYNVFQLNQAAGRDGLTNIAAKGLSGTGYEGHYFWDTEMYMLPYFIYTQPQLAKALLMYRHHILPQAKERAKTLGVNAGALFAWRTINGEEASAYYPAGTAQYHIDGDIAFAVGRYFEVTQDTDFLNAAGFEIVLETARFWANFGAWRIDGDGQRFEFFDVTGPDEYTAIVNNNYYTNRMAKHNLDLVAALKPFVKPDVLAKLGVTEDELAQLQKIAAGIYLPFNAEHQINAQDDSFFDKPIWPFDETPKANYPLLLHYHPLTIYRYQVAKQADTLLAEYLYPADTDAAQLQREYDYYEKVTTHDSSLSRSIFSMIAARLGNEDAAYRYFMDTAKMDLVDLQGNAEDGLHMANLGGSWLAMTTGFAGMTVVDGQLSLSNHLPKQWHGLTFRILFQGRRLQVHLDHDELAVVLLEGDALDVMLDGQVRTIKAA